MTPAEIDRWAEEMISYARWYFETHNGEIPAHAMLLATVDPRSRTSFAVPTTVPYLSANAVNANEFRAGLLEVAEMCRAAAVVILAEFYCVMATTREEAEAIKEKHAGLANAPGSQRVISIQYVRRGRPGCTHWAIPIVEEGVKVSLGETIIGQGLGAPFLELEAYDAN